MDKRPCTGAACLGMGLVRVRGTRTLALHGYRVPRRGFERALGLQQHEEVPHAQQHDHDEGEGVQDGRLDGTDRLGAAERAADGDDERVERAVSRCIKGRPPVAWRAPAVIVVLVAVRGGCPADAAGGRSRASRADAATP